MKTNVNNFRKLTKSQLNETLGGAAYYVIITLPNGKKIRVLVSEN